MVTGRLKVPFRPVIVPNTVGTEKLPVASDIWAVKTFPSSIPVAWKFIEISLPWQTLSSEIELIVIWPATGVKTEKKIPATIRDFLSVGHFFRLWGEENKELVICSATDDNANYTSVLNNCCLRGLYNFYVLNFLCFLLWWHNKWRGPSLSRVRDSEWSG